MKMETIYKRIRGANEALHLTAILLRSIAAGELERYADTNMAQQGNGHGT